MYGEALSIATALGYETTANIARLNMSDLEFEMGNTARAIELAEAVQFETRESCSERVAGWALTQLSAFRVALADFAAARTTAREAIRLARGQSDIQLAIGIELLATVAARIGDPRRAARIRGHVEAWYRRTGYIRQPTEQRNYESLMAALRANLSDAEIERLGAEGARLSEDQAVADALAV